MDVNRLKLLKEYINGNYAPILTDDQFVQLLPEHGSIDASNIETELSIVTNNNGEEQIPSWLERANEKRLLIIRNIDLLDKEVQKQLIEILKYRKISTMDINSNVIILLTCQNMDFSRIDEEIISLTIQTI